MKIKSNWKDKIIKFCFSFVFLFIFIFQTNFHKVIALPMDNYQEKIVVEELRLKVPQEYKEVWLKAEKKIWDPWLSSQDGFLSRRLYWDKEKEEALILVKWKNKKLWKSISIDQVNEVQNIFEDNVKKALKVHLNPFELIYEGELDIQE